MVTRQANRNDGCVDASRLSGLVDGILAAPEPNEAARLQLLALEQEGEPELLCASFESLFWRTEITNYWVFYLAARAYEKLGRWDAAFLTASVAARLEPEFSGAWAIDRILATYFRSRRRVPDADAVASRHSKIMPSAPLFSEAEIAAAGLVAEQPLEPDSDGQLDEMVAGVMGAPNPEIALLRYVVGLENEQSVASSLFESVCWRIEIRDYWTYYRMFSCYQMLGRGDAAFFMAAMADHTNPNISGSYATGREMFAFFRDRGRASDATDVFFEHAARVPHRPVAALWEMLPLLADTGLTLASLTGTGRRGGDRSSRRDMQIIPAEPREPWTCDIYGKGTVVSFKPLAERISRPAVEVTCIPNGELLIDCDAFAVRDANGEIHWDLSTHDFPMLLSRHIETLESAGTAVEQIELDEAIVIGDHFSSPPNLSHFLLDHFTRLELYRRAGIDIASATVIGGEPRAAFQKAALAKCGVANFLHTGRTARVRVRRLWVSSNCRGLRHPAHHGASWAIEFLRRTLAPERKGGARRLYVSRNDASVRCVLNEMEVVALLRRYGFEVILPGHLPFEQQIAAFATATHIVGPHGAGLTNIVVSPPGTHVLEIFHPLYGTSSYAALASEARLSYAALVGRDGISDAPEFNDTLGVDLSRNQFGSRDIRVSLPDLEQWLDKCLGTLN
jgi:tetratricopeptide (TPR) repeat protein